MTTTTLSHRPARALALVAAAAFMVAAVSFIMLREVNGGSLGLKETAKVALNTGAAIFGSAKVHASSRGQYTDIFFLHHSVGQNLIDQGGLGGRWCPF